uniref:dihydropyrimidine dehydrogenase (NADP(+)) n=1 Tax=Populus trichocarpa TaxID=3694 RepID=U5FPE1_POPTR
MASLSLTQIRGSNSVTEFTRLRLKTQRGRSKIGFLKVVGSQGQNQGEPDLSVTVNGLHMPNPFVIGSGPPGTNYTVMKRAFDEGWGAVIAKTDALEINFSCPHGMPERKMGAAVGQDCALLEEVCGWINAKATVPVWAKMTPNITDITQPARVSLKSGCEGVAAINTIMSVMGINLKTLRPEPCVEGYSTPGGYSSKAVHPIALGKVMSIAKMMKSEFDLEQYSLSGIGGVETGSDAAEFILVGANTVQVCTGVMMHGYGLVKKLCDELKDFMKMHNFSSIEDFRGASLEYFTTHMDLVRRQQEAIQQRKAIKKGLQSDKDWTGDGFVKETESMVSN